MAELRHNLKLNQNTTEMTLSQRAQLIKVNRLFYIPSLLGIILFIFMILKP